ncbi:MAG: hypothetical protein FJZ09_05380 [Candidatus Omnitrophica bacterium]|nr:hypothetical protein [Candidatus Omnitrophota bacterium]
MDKKDIYEHLAKIYLDASSKQRKKRKTGEYPKVFKQLFFVSVLLVVGLSISLAFTALHKVKPYSSKIALVLINDPVKINFNFDPAKKETLTLNLNKLDLRPYQSLAFSAKTKDYKDSTKLRIEFTTAFREKSEVYIKDVPHKWQNYRVGLSDFRGVSDWSQVRELTFTVEEWNTRTKHGLVFVDNVRLEK